MTLPEAALMLAGYVLVALAVSLRLTVRGAQARRWLRRVWRDLWPCLASALLWGLAAAGCSEKRDRSPHAGACDAAAAAHGTAPRPPGRYVRSPRGVLVWAPDWLDGALLTEALAEIDSTAPEADPRLSAPPAGVPVGMEAVVHDPGAFAAAASPTGVARGQTDMASFVRLSWRMRPWEDRPLLPALAHELRHVQTRDPQAGH